MILRLEEPGIGCGSGSSRTHVCFDPTDGELLVVLGTLRFCGILKRRFIYCEAEEFFYQLRIEYGPLGYQIAVIAKVVRVNTGNNGRCNLVAVYKTL